MKPSPVNRCHTAVSVVHPLLTYVSSALITMLLWPSSAMAQLSDADGRSSYQINFEQRLSKLERQMESGAGLFQMRQRLEQTQKANLQLQDRIDKLEFQLKRSEDRQKRHYTDTSERIKALEDAWFSAQKRGLDLAQTGTTDSQPVSSADATTTKRATPSSANAQDVKDYQSAFNQLLNGEYEAAIQQFQAFQRQHPQSPLQPKVIYWLGETYYSQQQYKLGKTTFKRFIKDYPQSSKMAEATYKLALCELGLNEQAVAKKRLNNLLKLYPDTNVANLARRTLDKVN